MSTSEFSVGLSRWRTRPAPAFIEGPRREILLATTIAFVGLSVVTLTQPIKIFYYDSGVYWALGTTFRVHGAFSLTNFDSPLRGYLLPLIDHCLAEIAAGLGFRPSTLAKLFNALVFSLLATIILPSIGNQAWAGRRWGVARRVLLAVPLAVLWGGYLAYPLSDFPALAAMLATLAVIGRSRRPPALFAAGALGAAALDIRPAYVVLPVAMLLLLLWSWFRERSSWRTCLAGAAAIVAGFALVSAPQALAMHRHFHTWSIVPGTEAGLSGLQYTDGLELQLYDTYVGPGRKPEMYFVSPTGDRILDSIPTHEIATAHAFLDTFGRHPLTMLGLFGAHLVNGLDQRYDTPYISDVTPRLPLRIIGFAILFIALVRVSWPRPRRAIGSMRPAILMAVLLAGISAVASAVEPRFCLPFAMLSYVVVSAPGWRVMAYEMREREPSAPALITIAASLILFLITVILVTADASAHLQFG